MLCSKLKIKKKNKGLLFYHSVWFRPGRIKTNYLIKSHEWWLGLGSCLNISVRPKSRHWRNNPNIIGSQCSHDTIERDDMKEIHSQAQVLRGYILPKDINGISKPLTFIISCRDSLDIPLLSLLMTMISLCDIPTSDMANYLFSFVNFKRFRDLIKNMSCTLKIWSW